MSEELRSLIQGIDEQLQELTIVCDAADSNPRYSAMHHLHPVISLQIPNKFYLLADRKTTLENMAGASVSKRLEMANGIIETGGMKISSTAITVETRLERESNRFLKQYRSKRKGGTYRKTLLEGHTKMLLFEGETETVAETSASFSVTQMLHFTGKSYEQLGERQQRRRRNDIKDTLRTTSAGLSSIGLSLTSVQLQIASTKEKLDILVHPLQDNMNNTDHTSRTDEDELQQIRDIMYLMLKHGVSFNFYHELCSRFKDLPRAYKVQQFKKDMPMPRILKTPGRNEGAQFDFNELFIEQLEQEIEEHPAYYFNEKHIRIRVSGDGAQYSRNSNLFDVIFHHQEWECGS